MIEEYKFGQITIDGKTYDWDVQVEWNGEVNQWRWQADHIIGVEDIWSAIQKNPESLVIGTGYEAQAELSEDAKIFIQEKGIKLFIDRTEEAIRTFNILKEESLEEEGVQDKVVGLFHLTS